MKTQACSECGRIGTIARGLCTACYQRWAARKRGATPKGPYLYRGVKVCTECGGKAWNHGLCRRCYARWWRKNSDRASLIEQKHEEKRHYGGHPEIARRIAAGCEVCGMSNADHKDRFGVRLHVHHRDHNGMASVSPNHDPSNLIVVCGPCHARLHAKERKAVSA